VQRPNVDEPVGRESGAAAEWLPFGAGRDFEGEQSTHRMATYWSASGGDSLVHASVVNVEVPAVVCEYGAGAMLVDKIFDSLSDL
jgi:hypothetical protein